MNTIDLVEWAFRKAAEHIKSLESRFDEINQAERDVYKYGIEADLDALGMAPVIAIGRVLHVAAGIADPGRLDAGQLADQVLHAPEATACEYSTFRHVKPP